MAERKLVWNFVAKDNASKSIKQMDKALGGLGTTIAVGVGNLAAEGFQKLTGAVEDGFKAAIEYQTLANKTAASIKATGNAAHISVKGVQALAAQQESLSGVDETLIINAENVLTAFKNVRNETGKGNDIFNQGTKEALNLSVALGKDLQSSTVMVGKALNDPVKGLTALGKAGVKFTDGQKKQIETMVKSGNVMGAQKIVLKGLEDRFGGVAQAAGAGAAGGIARLKDAVSDAFRDIALKALPILSKLGDWLAKRLPGWIDTAKKAIATFIAAFKGDATGKLTGGMKNVATAAHVVRIAFDALMKTGKALLDFYEHHKVLVKSLAVGLLAMFATYKVITGAMRAFAVAQALINTVMALNPIGLTIIALAGLAAGLIYAYKHSETFRNIVQGVMKNVTHAFENVVHAFDNVVHAIGNMIHALGNMGHAFGNMLHAVAATFGWIKDHWKLLLAILTGPIGLAVYLITKYWNKIKDGARTALDAVVRFFTGLRARLLKAVGNLATLLWNAGKDVLAGLLNGAKAGLVTVGKWVKDIGNFIITKIKGFFGIKSPSTVMAKIGGNLIGGLIKGMVSANPVKMIGKIFGNMPKALGAIVTKGFVTLKDLPGKALSALGGVFGLGSGTPHGGNQALGQAMAASFGWTGRQWQALQRLWSGESGWNNLAQNPTSTAFGIAQFLDSTWGVVGASKTSDPAGQIAAGLRYIQSFYGSPLNALNLWEHRDPHWYDNGGWLKPGYTLAYNGTGKSERVLGPGEGTNDLVAALVAAGVGTTNVTVSVDAPEFRRLIRIETDKAMSTAAAHLQGGRR